MKLYKMEATVKAIQFTGDNDDEILSFYKENGFNPELNVFEGFNGLKLLVLSLDNGEHFTVEKGYWFLNPIPRLGEKAIGVMSNDDFINQFELVK